MTPIEDDLHVLAARLDKHLRECGEQNIVTNTTLKMLCEGHETIESAIKGFRDAAWKGFLGILGVVAVSVGTVAVQNYTITAKQASKDEVSARAAKQYTAEDAARDRAAQADRDEKLMEIIK